jgi:hypothetical protein
MLKIIYYIYVGIRSFHPDLPVTKANDWIAFAPPTADLLRPRATRTFPIWLDDVYLSSRALAPSASSRFAESEDDARIPTPSVDYDTPVSLPFALLPDSGRHSALTAGLMFLFFVIPWRWTAHWRPAAEYPRSRQPSPSS